MEGEALVLARLVSDPRGGESFVQRRVAASERAYVVDALRRKSAALVTAALQQAGYWQGLVPGPRRFGMGARAVEVTAALVELRPDFIALHYNASALLAARRYRAAALALHSLEGSASSRLQRDLARLTGSIARSHLRESVEARELARSASESPFRVIAANAALTRVVQATQLADAVELRASLERCRDMFTDDAELVAGRLLSNYVTGGKGRRIVDFQRTLRSAGSMGEGVATTLAEVLRAC